MLLGAIAFRECVPMSVVCYFAARPFMPDSDGRADTPKPSRSARDGTNERRSGSWIIPHPPSLIALECPNVHSARLRCKMTFNCPLRCHLRGIA